MAAPCPLSRSDRSNVDSLARPAPYLTDVLVNARRLFGADAFAGEARSRHNDVPTRLNLDYRVCRCPTHARGSFTPGGAFGKPNAFTYP